MATRDYLDYLDSPEWWALRRQAMRRAQFRCERERPGETRHEGPLDVHHRHYRTLGCETLDDVEVLCSLCHHDEHAPRNRRKLLLESYGQQRLFDRWSDCDDDVLDAA